ncbi:MAG: heavy-metal-associated domain-containing protein [Oscillospiraceae bacterium]|nr:heavy-metal-associated domain-containing protein [Oscillospiraceae bacterium]
MDNYIIIAIIAVIALAAVGTIVKRKGRKGCCGSGSDYKPRKKKLKNVIATKTFKVDGMHCEKCSNRVTEAVNDIPGVAAVVNLKKGIVTVSYEQEVPDEQIKARIQRHGYTVTTIL